MNIIFLYVATLHLCMVTFSIDEAVHILWLDKGTKNTQGYVLF